MKRHKEIVFIDDTEIYKMLDESQKSMGANY